MPVALNKETRIFIAGHSGMLGSAFVRRLENDGYENLITVPSSEVDLTRQQLVDDLFARSQPEVVIMAAGRVGGIIENRDKPGDFIADNLAIQLNLMTAARRQNIKHLVFFASSCIYPRECPQPMAEAQLLTGKPEPTSQAYAMAKLAGLQSCLAYNQQDGGQRFLPLIPNTMYGPGDDFDLNSSHVLPALLRRFHEAKQQGMATVTLWGSGTPRREFVFVDDVVDAVMFLLQHASDELELPLNIGVGKDCSIAELALLIAEVVGYQGDIRWDTSKPDGAPQKLLDSQRLFELGWQPQTGLAAGIAKTYDWFVQQYGSVNDQV